MEEDEEDDGGGRGGPWGVRRGKGRAGRGTRFRRSKEVRDAEEEEKVVDAGG